MALSGTQLDGVSATDLVACPTNLPMDWSCLSLSTTGNTLVGPDANLSDLDLTGANFAGLNLSDARFDGTDLTNGVLTGANLSSANLTNVDLTDADLTDATLTGITWDNTTCPDGSDSDSNGNTCVDNL